MRIILIGVLCSVFCGFFSPLGANGFGGVSHVSAQAATDDERARTHFEAGRSYYEQARYDDAAREFQEAFQLSSRPALLLNLSQAYERALQFDGAITELQHYLQLVPDAPDRKTLEDRIAHLQELRSRVQTQPAAGAAPTDQTAQPTPTPAPAQPETAPAPAAATTTASTHGKLWVPGWILVGSGGALLAGALITGLVADGKHSDLEKACSGGHCPTASQSDIDSGKSMAVVSTVLLLVGIAAGGVGAALLVADGNKTEEQHASASLRLAPGPTPLGMGAKLVF